jgi:hypothetical protein
MPISEYYAYELKRKDNGVPFYVGKGSGNRCFSKRRNTYCQAVMNKYGSEVHIVVKDKEEEFIFLVEQELIHKYKLLGILLTNMTDGGEGMSGHIHSEETRLKLSVALKKCIKSDSHRMNLSKAKTGQTHSEATKEKMRLVRKGRPSFMLSKKHTEESKQKISEALSGEKNPFYGKIHTNESIDLIIKANYGKIDSKETRKKKSDSKMGDLNPAWSKKISKEQKIKQIATLKATIKERRIACPYCFKTLDYANAKRWHLDNCREKK